MSQPEPTSRPRWTAASIALFVIGLLILVPSGLCSGLMVLGSLYSLTSSSVLGPIRAIENVFLMWYMVFFFGGVPMAIGAALVYAGLKSRRRD